MARRSVSIDVVIAAPIEVVWSVIADARRFNEWTMVRRTELEREGSPTADGVGAIRRFSTAGVASREEIVAFEPPHHLGYVLLSGLPVIGYRADIRLEIETAGSTRLSWSSTFDTRRGLGRVMERFIAFVLGDFVRRLGREAPRRSAVGHR